MNYNYYSDQGNTRRVSVGWFVTLVAFSGVIGFLSDSLLGYQLPLEVIIRVLLLIQFIVLLTYGLRKCSAVPLLKFFIFAYITSSMITISMALFRGQEVLNVLMAAYFMFNVAIFIPFLTLTPANIKIGKSFAFLSIIAVLFGLVQQVTQDLLFSENLRHIYGIHFETFSNGQLRLTSFFNSPPRFAEFLSFLSLWLLYLFLEKGSDRWLLAMCYIVVAWLLYNTFSRSGYILYFSSTIIMIVIMISNDFKRYARISTAIYFLLIMLIGSIALSIVIDSFAESIIFDADSLFARLMHWENLLMLSDYWDLLQLLFGNGSAALYSRSSEDYYVVDNIFLAIIEYGGIIGLLLFLVNFFLITGLAYKLSRSKKSSRIEAILALNIGLIFEGQFLDNHNTIFLVQFVLIVFLYTSYRQGVSKTTNQASYSGKRASRLVL